MTKYEITSYSAPVLETTRAADGLHLDTDASVGRPCTIIGYRLARCVAGTETVLEEQTRALGTVNVTLAEACALLYGLRAAVQSQEAAEHLFIYHDNSAVYGSLYGARPANHDVFAKLHDTLPRPDTFSLIRIASEKNRAHDIVYDRRRAKLDGSAAPDE